MGFFHNIGNIVHGKSEDPLRRVWKASRIAARRGGWPTNAVMHGAFQTCRQAVPSERLPVGVDGDDHGWADRRSIDSGMVSRVRQLSLSFPRGTRPEPKSQASEEKPRQGLVQRAEPCGVGAVRGLTPLAKGTHMATKREKQTRSNRATPDVCQIREVRGHGNRTKQTQVDLVGSV